MIFKDDELFGRKAHQRFAQRALTRPIHAPQIAKEQSRSRLKTAVEDIETDSIEQIRCQRSIDPRRFSTRRSVLRNRKRDG